MILEITPRAVESMLTPADDAPAESSRISAGVSMAPRSFRDSVGATSWRNHMRTRTLTAAVALGLLFSFSALAANRDEIAALIEKDYAEIEKLYTHVHANPELSL